MRLRGLSLLLLVVPLFVLADGSPRLVVNTQLSSDHHQRHLLIEVRGDSDQLVDKIVLRLPRDVNTELIASGFLPEGWLLNKGRKRLTLSGDAHALPFKARLDFGRQDAPLQVRGRASLEGKTIYERDNLLLGSLPEIKVIQDLHGLLAPPGLLVPGDLVEMRLLGPDRTPPSGSWLFAGVPVRAIADPQRTGAGKHGGWLLRLRVPDDLQPGQKVAVSYFDDLGRRSLYVPQARHVRVVAQPSVRPEQAVMTRCAVRGVLGGGLCVGGWFPDDRARMGLLIDGKPAGAPVAASSHTLYLPLPTGLAPGKHTLSVSPEAGFRASKPFEFEVFDIQAELDQRELNEGLSASLTFFIVGSSEALRIRVINTTPDIIDIDGGNDQVVETFGGGGNVASREVTSLSLGNFEIEYELAEPRCPCSDSLDDDGLIRIPD